MLDTLDSLMPPYLPDPVNRHHPLAQGLAGWWLTLPGWDGGRYWYDLCGLTHGTLTGMGSGSGWRGTTRPGGWGHLLFDGVDDYVLSGPWSMVVGPGTALTLASWVRFGASQVSTGTRYLSYATNANEFTPILGQPFNDPTRIAATASKAGVADTNATGPVLTPGRWYHTLGVFDGASVTLYVDGVQQASTSYSGPVAGASSSVRGWSLGEEVFNGSPGGLYLNGSLDDVRIYSRTLSAAEVAALYNTTRLGCPGLLRRSGVPLPGKQTAQRSSCHKLLLRVG